MKTNYQLRSRAGNSTKKKILLALGVFGASIIFFSLLSGVFLEIFSPFWQAKNSLESGAENTFSYLRSRGSLVRENVELKSRLEEAESLLLSYRSIKDSHDALLSEVGHIPPDAILAGVLSGPPQTPYDILLLDKGSASGLSEGDKVALSSGAAIGSLSEVSGHVSKATLFSSYGIATNAVLERDNIPVTLTGRGGGNFEIKLPRDIVALPEDRILLPGLGANLVAIVRSADSRSTDSFQTVLAESPANIYGLRFVVITK